MYAVIETGGKQYKVKQGDTIAVEKLGLEKDASVDFDKVLLIGGEEIVIGRPYIEGAKVSAKVIEDKKDKKVIIQKYKRKVNYRRKRGHRQTYSLVKVEAISK